MKKQILLIIGLILSLFIFNLPAICAETTENNNGGGGLNITFLLITLLIPSFLVLLVIIFEKKKLPKVDSILPNRKKKVLIVVIVATIFTILCYLIQYYIFGKYTILTNIIWFIIVFSYLGYTKHKYLSKVK